MATSKRYLIFISYSTKHERQITKALYDEFVKNEYDAWYDKMCLNTGLKFSEEISEAIFNCDVFIALFSNEYFESEHCINELKLAKNYKKLILPFHLEEIKPYPPKKLGFVLIDIQYYKIKTKSNQEMVKQIINETEFAIMNQIKKSSIENTREIEETKEDNKRLERKNTIINLSNFYKELRIFSTRNKEITNGLVDKTEKNKKTKLDRTNTILKIKSNSYKEIGKWSITDNKDTANVDIASGSDHKRDENEEVKENVQQLNSIQKVTSNLYRAFGKSQMLKKVTIDDYTTNGSDKKIFQKEEIKENVQIMSSALKTTSYSYREDKKFDISDSNTASGYMASKSDYEIVEKENKGNSKLENSLNANRKLVICEKDTCNDYIASDTDIKTTRCETNTDQEDIIGSLGELVNKYIASGVLGDTIIIWEMSTGKCIKTLEGHFLPVCCFKEIGNGYMASGSLDNKLKIWNIDTERCIKTLEGHKSYVSCLQKLGNRYMVSGSKDRTIKIWEVSLGKCIKTLEGHSDTIYCLEELSNGCLVSGSSDKCIKIWNISSESCIKTLVGHTYLVNCLKELSDGLLASGSSDKTIKIWHINSGVCIKTLEGHTDWIYCLQELGNSHMASGSGDKTIKIWNVNTGECIQTIKGHKDGVYCLEILANGYMASGSNDNTIKIWEFNTWKCVSTLNAPTAAKYITKMHNKIAYV